MLTMLMTVATLMLTSEQQVPVIHQLQKVFFCLFQKEDQVFPTKHPFLEAHIYMCIRVAHTFFSVKESFHKDIAKL
jgi:hypothetical protein